MTFSIDAYGESLSEALSVFWGTRTAQAIKTRGRRVDGSVTQSLRDEVTGGKHLHGIERLLERIVQDSGVPSHLLALKRRSVPGYFRRTKDWDVAILVGGRPMAIIELKSLVGDEIGKNFNNRTDEALGQAVDVWKAAERGLLGSNSRLWIGYVMVLEDNESARNPTRSRNGVIFRSDPVFDGTSHADRFRIFFERMMMERFLDAACVVLTPRDSRSASFPSATTSFEAFVAALHGRVLQFRATNPDLDWSIN